MSKHNPPAFPRPFSHDAMPANAQYFGDGPSHEDAQEGMSLRDYFAAKAMQGELAAQSEAEMRKWDFGDEDQLAKWAYLVAGAMLAAREKQDYVLIEQSFHDLLAACEVALANLMGAAGPNHAATLKILRHAIAQAKGESQ